MLVSGFLYVLMPIIKLICDYDSVSFFVRFRHQNWPSDMEKVLDRLVFKEIFYCIGSVYMRVR